MPVPHRGEIVNARGAGGRDSALRPCRKIAVGVIASSGCPPYPEQVFEQTVLGVDPGMAATGLAVVGPAAAGQRHVSVLWFDTVRTPAGLAEPQRLRRIADGVRAAIADHRPAALAVERVMWGQNVTSALGVARATGVILLAAADAGLPVEEYAPLEVKMAITGVGNAQKDQVRAALVRAHRVAGVPNTPDAADAVAVAVCHLPQARMRAAAREAIPPRAGTA